MSSDRLKQIEELYHLVRECSPEQRAAALAEADAELRLEVESLLQQDNSKECGLDRPVLAVAAGLIEAPTVTTLMPGEQLGPYIIDKLLGAGGMGQVYKAHDTRLRRSVAIKVLASQFSSRFEREARAIASMNHPNICTLHDIGPNYLVMELLEGESLAARLKNGPLPYGLVVQYGIQLADALGAAHARGIIHRDLKPDNIMLTKSGLKVLDFGIASIQTVPGETQTASHVVMGTPAYMSPEQREGKPADPRTDIYSLGLILYEMASGERLVKTAEFRTLKSPSLERLIQACLKNELEDRWQSASDVKKGLEMVASAGVEVSPSISVARGRLVPWIIAVGVVAIIVSLWWMRASRLPAISPSEVSFVVLPPKGKELARVGGLSVDRISPDGSMILYRTADLRFYVRRLNSFESEALPAFTWAGDPFWAPDSQSIAFPTDNHRLMKMRIPKGAPELIASDENLVARGGSWGDKGTILFANSRGLYSIPADGGALLPVEITGLSEGGFYNPEFLPGGEDFLFEYVPPNSDAAQVYIATLRGGKGINPRSLLRNETAAAFTPAGGGHVLFIRNDNLYFQKLNVKARSLSGAPELIEEHVASNPEWRTAHFSVSRTGTVIWRSGTAVLSQVTVFDRKGNRAGIAGLPDPVNNIQLSPDESRLIASSEPGTWIVDAYGSGQVEVNLGRRPYWSHDGLRLIFDRGNRLMEHPIAGSSQPRQLAEIPADHSMILKGLLRGERQVLLGDYSGLFLFNLDGKGVPEQIVGRRADAPSISPDGTWLVYNYYNDPVVYAQPVSGSSVPREIAKTGSWAVWRADGKEIVYYDRTNGNISAVRVDGSGERLHFATPEPLFRVAAPIGGASASHQLAVSANGSRIYFLQSAEQSDSGVIKVRTNAIR